MTEQKPPGHALEFNVTKQPLKYLFTALYRDGSHLIQTPDDVSATSPGKSAMADVRHEDLIGFFLTGEGHSFGVNLTDGTFIIDQAPPVRFHSADNQLLRIELIYHRQVDVEISTRLDIPKVTGVETTKVVYCLGFRAISALDGHPIERIMEIE